MGPTGSHRGPQAPYPPAHPRLTHTVLAPRAKLEARVAGTPEAAICVDAAAAVAQVAAHKALVHVWVGVGTRGRWQAVRLGHRPQKQAPRRQGNPSAPALRPTAVPTHACLATAAWKPSWHRQR